MDDAPNLTEPLLPLTATIKRPSTVPPLDSATSHLTESESSSSSSSSSLPCSPNNNNNNEGNNNHNDHNHVEPTTTTTTNTPPPAVETNPWKNHNVRLSIMLCIVSGIADSIWGSVVLSGFLFALGKAMGKAAEDNTLVGAAEMVQGLTMLVAALPVGILADRTGKARVVRMGGILMLLTIAMTLAALWIVNEEALENAKAATQSY